jgi:transposase
VNKFSVSVDVHLVMDNYGTRKVTKVRTWLARHPRYHLHFTPTSDSWLNIVDGLFAELAEPFVRRRSYAAVRFLEKAMLGYSGQRNTDPSPLSGPPSGPDLGPGQTPF